MGSPKELLYYAMAFKDCLTIETPFSLNGRIWGIDVEIDQLYGSGTLLWVDSILECLNLSDFLAVSGL